MKNANFYLKQIVSSLKKIDPLKVIVFGSCASGLATKESDIDLFVILDSNKISKNYEERLQKKLLVREQILNLSFQTQIDLMVYSRAEYQKLKNESWYFANEIEKRGKIIYEKAS